MDGELNKLLSCSFSEINGNGKLIISLLQLSKKYFNLPQTDCQNEHERYFAKLKTIKHTPMKKQRKNYLDKKYILRKGVLLYYNSTHFSNDTLTDSVAEKAIKKFPKLANLFLNAKERKVLEALDSGTKHVREAEEDLHNDPILEEIAALVKDEQYEDAIKKEEAEKKAAEKKIADQKAADKKKEEADKKASDDKK